GPFKRCVPSQISHWSFDGIGNPKRIDVCLMIRSYDQSAANRNVSLLDPAHSPEQAAERAHHWTTHIQGPLRKHSRIRTRADASRRIDAVADKTQRKSAKAEPRKVLIKFSAPCLLILIGGNANRISGCSSPGPAPRIRAVPADSDYRHSVVHIESNQNHGTELLLVSSNQFDFLPGNPQKHNVAQSPRVTECVENRVDARYQLYSQL